jgi:[ribosomal protein S5]-alanine N-acetyltransferase
VLHGKQVTLRPVRAIDLDELYTRHIEIANRGHYFPINVMSETGFRKQFEDDGFWGKDEGMMVILDASDRIVGHVEFFRAVPYWDAYELSYQLYDPADAGRGYMTEAVRLLVDYLFETKPRHRIHLVILPDNAASRRIAEKCGFTLEATLREPFFHRGKNVDVLMYSLLRTDPRPWHEAATGM